jgi:hypothetical protein
MRRIRWVAWSYAGISALILLMTPLVRDESFSLFAALTAVPLLGYVFATVGRINVEDPVGNPVSAAIFLILNALWCFVFVWTILRIALQVGWAMAPILRSLKRKLRRT